jgi:O-acetylhomoserine/O-acetylserine sulfhydrylase-like pyridoxal-dependent enzyme
LCITRSEQFTVTFKLINAVEIFSITANLGDTKSTITHPATTTHGRLSDEEKTNANIADGLSIGGWGNCALPGPNNSPLPHLMSSS